jgi:hypothetical protein
LDGRVLEIERGGDDDGAPYVCRVAFQPDHMGSPGGYKSVCSARTKFLAGQPINAQISATPDYAVRFPPALNADALEDNGAWDDGAWNGAVWDGSSATLVSSRWQSIGQSGVVIAMQIQVTCGSGIEPVAELLALDVIYEPGSVVV